MKPILRHWQVFGVTALTHYTALCLYSYLKTKTNHETPLTTVVFFVGLLAWILSGGLFLLFRKRTPVIARLSLFVFISSLMFGLLWTSPTD